MRYFDKTDLVTLVGLGLLFWGAWEVSLGLALSAVGLVVWRKI